MCGPRKFLSRQCGAWGDLNWPGLAETDTKKKKNS